MLLVYNDMCDLFYFAIVDAALFHGDFISSSFLYWNTIIPLIS